MKRILQIIPAPGWFAAHTQDNGSLFYYRLACWALVTDEDEPGSPYVTGMDASDFVEHIEDMKSFSHYVHESEMSAERLQSIKTAGDA